MADHGIGPEDKWTLSKGRKHEHGTGDTHLRQAKTEWHGTALKTRACHLAGTLCY